MKGESAMAIINEMAQTIEMNGKAFPIVGGVPKGYKRVTLLSGVVDEYEFYCDPETGRTVAVDVRKPPARKGRGDTLCVDIRNRAQLNTQGRRILMEKAAAFYKDVQKMYEDFLTAYHLDGIVQMKSYPLVVGKLKIVEQEELPAIYFFERQGRKKYSEFGKPANFTTLMGYMDFEKILNEILNAYAPYSGDERDERERERYLPEEQAIEKKRKKRHNSNER